jgi:Mn-dependent DtxR family transcriptional regulator
LETLTIHFHLKHFRKSRLSIGEYMFLMLYEIKNDWSLKELGEVLFVSEKTIRRIRNKLTKRDYLKSERRGKYSLTDKLYLKNEK